MSVINTNYLALVSQNNLTKSQNSLGTAIERLSSGLRINSAKDDAAGQAIANRFTANVNGLTQAARNANDGISLAQTTEGALNEINENLQRIRTLSNQAVTGTNSDTDLQSIQDEIKERLDEINRVSEQTQFNGVKVLGEANNTLKIQVGAHDGQTIDINLSKIDQESLGLAGFNVASGASAAKVGGKLTAKVGGADTEFTFSATPATGAASKEVALPTTVANPTGVTTGTSELVTKGDSGEYYIKHTDTDKTVSFYAASFTAVAGQDNTATDPDPSNAAAPALTVVAGTKLDDAAVEAAGLAPATDKPLAAIDGALKQVDELRSHLGAIQNRFQSTIANLNNTVNNLSAARSRIEDADYAVEVSNMTRSQILQQAGTSVLAQANQVPQTVLSLLR